MAAITISPGTPVVEVGQTQTFTASGGTAPYTWSLASGSVGSIDSSTGVYTAPSTAQAQQTYAGCPVLPNDHVYNTRIDALPVNSNSATWMAKIGSVKLQAVAAAFPLNIVNSTTPTTAMTFEYTPGANADFQMLSAPYLAPESGLYAPPTGGEDRHILSVNTDTCQYQEIYQLYPVGDNADCLTCNSQAGVKYMGTDYALNVGTTAAGTYELPLAVRYSELLNGTIRHALEFTLSDGLLASSYVWPATSSGIESGPIPYGTRFRLKSSVSCSAFTVWLQYLCTALKDYGMFVTDGGITGQLSMMADAPMDINTANAIYNKINSLNMDDFEVVDESSFEISAGSGQVNPSNGYAPPATYATVIATDSTMATGSEAIAIQPVTVGTVNIPYPPNEGVLMTMAGTPQFQIPVIVNGTSNTAITCSMTPSYGTLTSGCLYTPPVSLTNALDETTVTITSQADSNVSYSFPLYIFPSDGIRMHLGPKCAQQCSNPSIPYDADGDYGPDVNGKYWWRQLGIPFWYYFTDASYPQGDWPAGYPDIGLYYTGSGGTQDAVFGVLLPNADYQIHLLFGNTAADASQTFNIESQASTFYNAVSICTFMNSCGGYTPGNAYFAVRVQNNQLYVAIRELSTNVQLNAFSITPVVMGAWVGF